MRRRVLTALVVLVITVVTGTLLVFPTVGAVACPGCYGLEPLGRQWYVEAELPTAERVAVEAAVEVGAGRVARFYGEQRSAPTVLACRSAPCYRRIGGGGERGIAVLNRVVLLSPRGIDPAIAAHEMAHVELAGRLGSAKVPQWFDEGLAVLVSDDPRYLRAENGRDRCLASTPGPLPLTLDRWLADAGADRRLYARAACRVHRWAAARGGSRAVLDLVERVHGGADFETVTGGLTENGP